jgi:hypothetical protein
VPLLALTVFELTVIHDAADRRNRSRRYLNQVELGLFGHFVRAGETHDPDLFTARSDQSNFGCGDLAVDPGFLFLGYAIDSWLVALTPRVHAGLPRLSNGK